MNPKLNINNLMPSQFQHIHGMRATLENAMNVLELGCCGSIIVNFWIHRVMTYLLWPAENAKQTSRAQPFIPNNHDVR